MAEIHASRLCRLPDDLLHHLMAAVDLGLTSDAGPDIAKACLELVASLAAHVCTDPALHGTTAYKVGAHFLEVLPNQLPLPLLAGVLFSLLLVCLPVCLLAG